MAELESLEKGALVAYLFDPVLAVHISLVTPLPYQITAVYGQMLEHRSAFL